MTLDEFKRHVADIHTEVPLQKLKATITAAIEQNKIALNGGVSYELYYGDDAQRLNLLPTELGAALALVEKRMEEL